MKKEQLRKLTKNLPPVKHKPTFAKHDPGFKVHPLKMKEEA